MKKTAKGSITNIFILLLIVTASFSLLGFLSGFNVMYFELMVNFRLQYLLLAIVLLFFFLSLVVRFGRSLVCFAF